MCTYNRWPRFTKSSALPRMLPSTPCGVVTRLPTIHFVPWTHKSGRGAGGFGVDRAGLRFSPAPLVHNNDTNKLFNVTNMMTDFKNRMMIPNYPFALLQIFCIIFLCRYIAIASVLILNLHHQYRIKLLSIIYIQKWFDHLRQDNIHPFCNVTNIWLCVSPQLNCSIR